MDKSYYELHIHDYQTHYQNYCESILNEKQIYLKNNKQLLSIKTEHSCKMKL